MNKFNVFIETDRLVIRPLEKGDYISWLSAFENRLPSQHQYDEGKIDMSICTKDWFGDLIDRHQRLASEDKVYIFGVFRKEDLAHIGSVDFSTMLRDEFQ